MHTPLALRPLDIRLMVAYMAHAQYDFDQVDPGNTYDRHFAKSVQNGPMMYNRMWNIIGSYYTNLGFQEFSDKKIKDAYTKALTTGKAVSRAVDQWNEYGWTEYEHRRDGRRRAARQWGMPVVALGAACFGIALPQA